MLVVDKQSIDQDLLIEIRSCGSDLPGAAEDLRRLEVCLLERSRLFRLEGVAELDPEHLAVLFDPLVETVTALETAQAAGCVDVFCRPGVTDAEGEMAALALSCAGLFGARCHAGYRYRFAAPIPPSVRPAVERSLGNPLIHTFCWNDERRPVLGSGHRYETSPVEQVAAIELRCADDEALREISLRWNLALDLDEMRAIAGYFEQLGRAPTDVELQSLALTWSEHCSHKTFKASIDFAHDGRCEHISGLLHTYLITPMAELHRPWVRSAFVDNAGVVAFDRRHDLAVKVETHNHPSALEPYGGAHTGVGGVIRDVLGVSAEPIANTDVLCFGPLDLPDDEMPPGVFHPRTTFRGVVRGVADYGNNMGIPTVGGAILFHPGFTANPLVYCGTLGLAPRGRHPRQPRPGDAVVLLGGRTGRDGLHGATMSSASLDRASVAGSTVQIGAPITEKTLRDVLPRLRDEGLYHAITDCGAGGLCSAVGEMGAQLGVEIDLARVPLKYEGLRPWEIWLSEAQERMVLAVPIASLPRLLKLCRAYDVEATVIGRFRQDGTLRIYHGSTCVANLDMRFLHGGRPTRTLQARWEAPPVRPYRAMPADPAFVLLRLLAHANIASKEHVIRRYDHEVGAATVVGPLVGNAGPADAAVLRPLPGSWRGVIVAHGINPFYGETDPHAMAMLAVDEALRNLVAAGGSIDRAALLDNFCWGDVDDPAGLGRLVRTAQGCRDAALAYRVPFISGKDSLRNTSADGTQQRSIPGTLLISALGVVPDVRRAVTTDLKTPGSAVYLLGHTADELGGSHYQLVVDAEGGRIPCVRPRETPRMMRRLTRAMRRGLVLSCHDLSEGGLAVAAAEMALVGGLGLELELSHAPRDTDAVEALLFAESPGRFLVEVEQERRGEFERVLGKLPYGVIGSVTSTARIVIRLSGKALIDRSLGEIEAAWRAFPAADALEVARPSVAAFAPAGRIAHGAGSGIREREDGAPSPSRGHGRPRYVNGNGHGRTGYVIRAMVLAAPGVNCDRETVEACRLAGATVELVHLNQLLSGECQLRDFGMLVLPGGFSYGDHLGAGAMLATILRHRLLDELQRFVDDGRPVLGICNGFQVLARLGLLGDVTLVSNSSGRFECRWVRLRVEPSTSVFLQGLEWLELPIAHGQGRVVVTDEVLAEQAQQVTGEAMCTTPLRYRENPNGSMDDIAGMCNAAGNVLGLMPHPERYLDRYHHPDWTRRASLPPPGLILFQNAVRYVQEAL